MCEAALPIGANTQSHASANQALFVWAMMRA
jgi:hypothetical protein